MELCSQHEGWEELCSNQQNHKEGVGKRTNFITQDLGQTTPPYLKTKKYPKTSPRVTEKSASSKKRRFFCGIFSDPFGRKSGSNPKKVSPGQSSVPDNLGDGSYTYLTGMSERLDGGPE